MTDLNNAETQTDAPCSAINYCNLNGYELTAEEKIIFLSSYVSRIDNETVYQPATREFVQNFNVDAAISIINNYATADSFFRKMTGSFPYIKNSQRFSSPDIYFLLLELKLYINERRRVIAKNNSADTLSIIEQYKNRYSFNQSATQKMEALHSIKGFAHPSFFVPETVLYINENSILYVHSALRYIDMLLEYMQRNDNSIDYEIYSFFQNFKSMLFNNEHDTTPTYIIDQSRDYIYSILGNSKRKSKMTDICKYAAFVESLTELGNAISASNMKL